MCEFAGVVKAISLLKLKILSACCAVDFRTGMLEDDKIKVREGWNLVVRTARGPLEVAHVYNVRGALCGLDFF